ncbi:predicted protein [Lodderomyces elongisporus NRRL YB-4239]|uniref:Uncharacterized protein n=1 Tax=Lodderomyces elongisporus (strain ATCC 11503 / CBS 2605 / JCM 1781 / NBRC 1676 / NRRL YB-4239) TaxID=379508 RepID=A5DYY7_LODEL|nr:predicted protein [Lodderomyces elongisporus NRRL YB-4239]
MDLPILLPLPSSLKQLMLQQQNLPKTTINTIIETLNLYNSLDISKIHIFTRKKKVALDTKENSNAKELTVEKHTSDNFQYIGSFNNNNSKTTTTTTTTTTPTTTLLHYNEEENKTMASSDNYTQREDTKECEEQREIDELLNALVLLDNGRTRVINFTSQIQTSHKEKTNNEQKTELDGKENQEQKLFQPVIKKLEYIGHLMDLFAIIYLLNEKKERIKHENESESENENESENRKRN